MMPNTNRIVLLASFCLTAQAAAPLVDYVSLLGGSVDEFTAGLAVDATGSAYIAGTTDSPNFPLTSTTLGTPAGNNPCAFVTKFNPSGSGLDFSVCLSASRAIAFALDPTGNIYLLAIEQLSSAPAPSSFAVVKLDPTGQTVLSTAPVGSAAGLTAESMAVDASGNVYVAGAAGPGLAATPGTVQPNYAGADQCPAINVLTPCANAFLTKLLPSGAVAWTTYLGGSGPDDAHAIAVDGDGNVWVAGETLSPNFPTTPGAISRTFHGEVYLGGWGPYGDAFVAKLDPTGSHLLYSTYLGGSGADAAYAIALDPTGAGYVAGSTQSTDFPTTSGALSTTYSGSATNVGVAITSNGLSQIFIANGFVTKLDASGNLIYSTFTGVPNSQSVAIAVDATGQAYASVNLSPSIQDTCPASPNPAVLVLNPAGSALTATSPIPGAYLTVDGKGDIYSAGIADPVVFFASPYAFQTEYGGGDTDAFVAKVDITQPAAPSLGSVLNAASLQTTLGSGALNAILPGLGAIAPGEIVSLFGNGFGASPTVTFGGIPGPVIYASDCQINAVVPFGVAPGRSIPVTVQFDDRTRRGRKLELGPVSLPVVTALPGIFDILNQDNTMNSPSNPAPPGSIISIFLTGAGVLTPPLADGSVGPLTAPFPAPAASVSVTINSVNAPVTFVGQAPGQIAGLTQVNVQVPENSSTGPITVYFAGFASQSGMKLAVQ